VGQSNAERQAAYRARHLKSEDGRGERLNLVVDLHAKACLARLARHYGTSQRQVLERLLGDAELAVLEGLRDKSAYEAPVTR
jgi:hypothetical protein